MGFKSFNVKSKLEARAGIILVLALVSLLLVLGCRAQKSAPRPAVERPKIGKREAEKRVSGRARVVFVSLRDGNEEIYLMDANGKNQTRVTRNTTPDAGPQASPDGERVAWRGKGARGQWQLYTLALGSREPTLLATTGGGDVLSFSWSPHSNWIALIKAFGLRGDRHLWLMSSSGGSQASLLPEVAESSEDDAAWFPDNKRLSYVSEKAGDVPKIFWRFVPVSTGPLFLSSGTKPAVSPDGKWVALVNLQGEIAVVPTQGGAPRVLAQMAPASGTAGVLQWSPDSKLVLFGALFQGSLTGSGISVVNVDGTGFKKLTNGFNPRWGPDGKRVFFEDLGSGDAAAQARQIWSVNSDGTARLQLTHDGENYSPFPFVALE